MILCKLGFWQLDRADQKRLALSQVEQNQSVLLDTFIDHIQNDQLTELHSKRVTFEGLPTGKYWLVDNKVHHGQVGYTLLSEARIQGTDQTVLVDLGWWPAQKSRQQLPEILLPETFTTTAYIKSQDLEQFTLEQGELQNATKQVRIQNAIDALQLKPDLPRLILYAESNTIEQRPQIYKPVVMPPEKHTAYAVQWFLLALALVIIYLRASYQKNNSQSNQGA